MASTSGFWSTTFNTPATPTPDPNPLHNIDGSSDDASTNGINKANSENTFPYMDGSTPDNRLPSPKDVNGNEIDLQTVNLSDITPDFFQGLHSGHQLELLNRFGGDLVLGTGDERLDVLRGADDRTVLILQNLSKNDIGLLGKSDQDLIAAYTSSLNATAPGVVANLASVWDVSLGNTPAENRIAADLLLDNALHKLLQADSNNKDAYKDQLNLIKDRISRNSLFSTGNLTVEIKEIFDRFDRMNAFELTLIDSSASLNPDDTSSVPEGLNSQDNNASIISGLNNLLAQEKRLLDLATQRISLSRNASVQGKKMDVPSLISMLQLTYNIQKEADVAILTEELQQQNALLRDYAEMQRIVNNVLKQFPSGEDGSKQKRNIEGTENGKLVKGAGGVTWAEANMSLSVKERRAMIMFSTEFSGAAPQGGGHPLETLRRISRPLDDFTVTIQLSEEAPRQTFLTAKTQSAWNIYSTQLADAVTLINQNSQILTNEISSMNQERNRHFDLANNSLRRLNDSLTSIARM